MTKILSKHHSVRLEKELCNGCTNCIKRCPTEAIRIRKGKAVISEERCIDCGECIRRCPYRAKKAFADSVSMMYEYAYKIALPAPSLYGQFSQEVPIDVILTSLLDFGFDQVVEVSLGAEIISNYTSFLLSEGRLNLPAISSACPTISKLIRIRYPDLCENVLPVISPMQATARLAKQEAIIEKGYSEEEVGVFFISPCPAKITAARNPIGIKRSWVDGAFSMADIYPKLIETVGKIKDPKPLARSGISGVKWSISGGEASAILPTTNRKYLAADGIENVMSVLEALEEDRLGDVDFIELNTCPGGCVGGVLTGENPFVAKARIQHSEREDEKAPYSEIRKLDPKTLDWTVPLERLEVMRLSSDRKEALRIMGDIERINKKFPSLDCGSCGAPTCRALAEDVALEIANIEDCIFNIKSGKVGTENDESE